MRHTTTPVPVREAIDPDRVPRTLSHPEMRQHQEQGAAVQLSKRDRHRMFLYYDQTWWIGDPDGFTEITDPAHNARLNVWQTRLAQGALWN